jgi:hypothetical protein
MECGDLDRARDLSQRLKMRLQDPGLRTAVEQAPFFRRVDDLRATG